MNEIVFSFSILFAATIALICAVYVYLIYKDQCKMNKLNKQDRRLNGNIQQDT